MNIDKEMIKGLSKRYVGLDVFLNEPPPDTVPAFSMLVEQHQWQGLDIAYMICKCSFMQSKEMLEYYITQENDNIYNLSMILKEAKHLQNNETFELCLDVAERYGNCRPIVVAKILFLTLSCFRQVIYYDIFIERFGSDKSLKKYLEENITYFKDYWPDGELLIDTTDVPGIAK